MKEKKYSIIIPHKDSLLLLQRCVQTIPLREDIEVFVVDDNSDIGDSEWKSFRSHFEKVCLILTKDGKGAGYARNVGLDKATGKWLLFADADDYFYPHAFDVIDNYLLANDVDMVYFYANSRDGVTGKLIKDRWSVIKRGIESQDFDLLRYKSYVPWGKVVKREIVEKNSINFDEVEASNDVMFSTLVGYYSQKVGVIDEALYCCTKNNSSLFYRNSKKRIWTRLQVAVRVNQFLNQKGLLQRYRYDVSNYIFFFFPRHPIMFVRALFNCRYPQNTLLFLRDILYMCGKKMKNRLLNKN